VLVEEQRLLLAWADGRVLDTRTFLEEGQWHHLVLSRDLDHVTVQHDGFRILEETLGGLPTPVLTRLVLGSDCSQSPSLHGKLDEIQWYRRSLAEQEQQQLYAVGLQALRSSPEHAYDRTVSLPAGEPRRIFFDATDDPLHGVILDLPAGTFAQDVLLAFGSARIAEQDYQPVGPQVAVMAVPEATFLRPVLLTLPFNPQLLTLLDISADQLTVVRHDDELGRMEAFEDVTIDPSAGTAQVMIDRFSVYSVVAKTIQGAWFTRVIGDIRCDAWGLLGNVEHHITFRLFNRGYGLYRSESERDSNGHPFLITGHLVHEGKRLELSHAGGGASINDFYYDYFGIDDILDPEATTEYVGNLCDRGRSPLRFVGGGYRVNRVGKVIGGSMVYDTCRYYPNTFLLRKRPLLMLTLPGRKVFDYSGVFSPAVLSIVPNSIFPEAALRLSLYNAAGQEIYSTTSLASTGSNFFWWNGSDSQGQHVPTGWYYVVVTAEASPYRDVVMQPIYIVTREPVCYDPDGDLVCGSWDSCPRDPLSWGVDFDRDGKCNLGPSPDPDADGDGWLDADEPEYLLDNASEWQDSDLDGLGDNADPDDDNDGVDDKEDQCPLDAEGSEDLDHDGLCDYEDDFVDVKPEIECSGVSSNTAVSSYQPGDIIELDKFSWVRCKVTSHYRQSDKTINVLAVSNWLKVSLGKGSSSHVVIPNDGSFYTAIDKTAPEYVDTGVLMVLTGQHVRYILLKYLDQDSSHNVFANVNANDYLGRLDTLLMDQEKTVEMITRCPSLPESLQTICATNPTVYVGNPVRQLYPEIRRILDEEAEQTATAKLHLLMMLNPIYAPDLIELPTEQRNELARLWLITGWEALWKTEPPRCISYMFDNSMIYTCDPDQRFSWPPFNELKNRMFFLTEYDGDPNPDGTINCSEDDQLCLFAQNNGVGFGEGLLLQGAAAGLGWVLSKLSSNDGNDEAPDARVYSRPGREPGMRVLATEEAAVRAEMRNNMTSHMGSYDTRSVVMNPETYQFFEKIPQSEVPSDWLQWTYDQHYLHQEKLAQQFEAEGFEYPVSMSGYPGTRPCPAKADELGFGADSLYAQWSTDDADKDWRRTTTLLPTLDGLQKTTGRNLPFALYQANALAHHVGTGNTRDMARFTEDEANRSVVLRDPNNPANRRYLSDIQSDAPFVITVQSDGSVALQQFIIGGESWRYQETLAEIWQTPTSPDDSYPISKPIARTNFYDILNNSNKIHFRPVSGIFGQGRYDLWIGRDTNGDTELAASEGQYILPITVINEEQYFMSQALLISTWQAWVVAGHDLASTLLSAFLSPYQIDPDNPQPGALLIQPTRVEWRRLTPDDLKRNSERAGANFSYADGTTRIPSLIYNEDSSASRLVSESATMSRAVLRDAIPVENVNQRISAWYGSHPTSTTHIDTLTENEIPNEHRIISKDFEVLDGKYSDVHLALGTADFNFTELQIETIRTNQGIFVQSVTVRGYTNDLYDFDYQEEDLTEIKDGAVLQYGWSAGYGSAGAIFWTEIHFHWQYRTMDCRIEEIKTCQFAPVP